MSDTPRTDNFRKKVELLLNDSPISREEKAWSAASDLERELNAANARIAELEAALSGRTVSCVCGGEEYLRGFRDAREMAGKVAEDCDEGDSVSGQKGYYCQLGDAGLMKRTIVDRIKALLSDDSLKGGEERS